MCSEIFFLFTEILSCSIHVPMAKRRRAKRKSKVLIKKKGEGKWYVVILCLLRSTRGKRDAGMICKQHASGQSHRSDEGLCGLASGGDERTSRRHDTLVFVLSKS